MSKKKQSQANTDPLVAAREVARAVVARHWPDLAAIEPTVTPRRHHTPTAEELQRLGISEPAEAHAAIVEYTFTFTMETRTQDGHTLHRSAHVTVDDQEHVVKATISK